MTDLPDAGWAVPLFVPATRPERFAKAAAAGADIVVIDLEDAVDPADKAAARMQLLGLDLSSIMVRINAEATSWHADDLAVLSGRPLGAIMLAKAESVAGLVALAGALGPEVGLVPLIETATGLANARAIAMMPGVRQLVFGSIDYCADLGCAHTRTALLGARTELVLASRLAGIAAPIDGVTAKLNDPDETESDARHAAELGFGGKLAIHPSQIGPIRRGFAPTAAEVAWAQQIVGEIEGGAVAVGGSMVDEPVRKRARAVLDRAARVYSALVSSGTSTNRSPTRP